MRYDEFTGGIRKYGPPQFRTFLRQQLSFSAEGSRVDPNDDIRQRRAGG
jgi:hypothetical protein